MISLFVRSYPNDFDWLSHSIMSMKKNLIGVDDRVLCVPIGSDVPNAIASFFDKVVYSDEEGRDGYVAQQIDKIRAYKHCAHQHILFSDSDCFYFNPFDATKMIEDEHIRLYMTKYSSMDGAVLQWQGITQIATDILPGWEYMRCLPIMHHAITCHHLDNLTHYNNYLQTMTHRALSEFNALGIIAAVRFPSKYKFIDTEVELPKQQSTQFWSWGGITEEIARKIGELYESKH